MNSKISTRNTLAIVIAAIFVVIAGILFSVARSENIDYIPEDGTDINFSSQVNIISEDNLAALLGGVKHKEMLSKDLYVFARTAYEKYSEQPEVIGFKVSKVTESDDAVLLEGRFGATKNKVLLVVKPLNHGMINSSITDSKTNLNVDESLPSNSTRNQFIGSLPIENPNFVIDYVDDTDSFTVNVFNGSQNYDEAQATITKGLGIDDLSSENIIYYGVGTGGYNNDY